MLKKILMLQFQDLLRSLQTGIKILICLQPAIALVSMTGGRGRGSRGASSSNSISSGVKTRAAKASGVGAVSGAKCGMCMASLGNVSLRCDGCNSRYHLLVVTWGCLILLLMQEYGSVSFSCTWVGWRREMVVISHSRAV